MELWPCSLALGQKPRPHPPRGDRARQEPEGRAWAEAVYTFYRVRKLRTEERLAALARGAEIPMEPELTQFARSRRSGILLVSSGVGFIVMFAMIARVLGERETLVASAFGILPLAVGLGYFVDAALIRRDLKMG